MKRILTFITLIVLTLAGVCRAETYKFLIHEGYNDLSADRIYYTDYTVVFDGKTLKCYREKDTKPSTVIDVDKVAMGEKDWQVDFYNKGKKEASICFNSNNKGFLMIYMEWGTVLGFGLNSLDYPDNTFKPTFDRLVNEVKSGKINKPATSTTSKPSTSTASTTSKPSPSATSKPAAASAPKQVSALGFFTNQLGVSDIKVDRRQQIIESLSNKAGFTSGGFIDENQRRYIYKNPPYKLADRQMTEYGFNCNADGILNSYWCDVFGTTKQWTKEQALRYAKSLVSELSNKGYKFQNITSDIGAVYAMECRQGSTTYTVQLYTEYEAGKIIGYKVTAIKANYGGLIVR